MLCDVATGREQGTLKLKQTAHSGALAFSPDGRWLAVNCEGGVELLNLPLLVGGSKRVGPEELPVLWNDLRSTDAAILYRSQCRLILAGPDAVEFLSKKLGPLAAPPADRVEQLLKDLGSDKFAVRHQATLELQQFGQAAGPSLRKALHGAVTLEERRRIETLLKDQADPRQDCALEILETLGADRLLQTLAAGLSDARLTVDAQAALTRLKKRTPQP